MNRALQAPPPERVDTPRGAIAYRSSGDATRVSHVLLHGIGSASASWQAQLDWARGRTDVRLLAWDAPGYGLSSPLEPAWPQAGDYGQQLWAWLDALGVRTPLVLVRPA